MQKLIHRSMAGGVIRNRPPLNRPAGGRVSEIWQKPKAHIRNPELAVIMSRRDIVSASCLDFRHISSNQNNFTVEFNEGSKSLVTTVPTDAAINRTICLRQITTIEVIFSNRAYTQIFSAIIKSVVIDMVDDHARRNRSKNLLDKANMNLATVYARAAFWSVIIIGHVIGMPAMFRRNIKVGVIDKYDEAFCAWNFTTRHAARSILRGLRGRTGKSEALTATSARDAAAIKSACRHLGIAFAERQLLTTEGVRLSAMPTADVPPSRSIISDAVSMSSVLRYA